MDEREVEQWILPDDYDSAIAESKHLIHEADINKVGYFSISVLFVNIMRQIHYCDIYFDCVPV